jgi:hypothetical protein
MLRYLPQLLGFDLPEGNFRSSAESPEGCFLIDFSACHIAPNLQKLPDGRSDVVE